MHGGVAGQRDVGSGSVSEGHSASLNATVPGRNRRPRALRLTALPEGIGGLAGLRWLQLSGNGELTALTAGLCALAGLEYEPRPET